MEETCPSVTVADLGPPLDILPHEIDPGELQAYRQDYQAFRTGQAAGARGEIRRLVPAERESLDADNGDLSVAAFAGSCLEVGQQTEVEAYDSEPELWTTGSWEQLADIPTKASIVAAASVPLQMSSADGVQPQDKATSRVPGAGFFRSGHFTQLHSRLDFATWLGDEVRSRPDEAQLHRIPKSHLPEVTRVPYRVEKILGFGFLLCLDILLHELSFMPLQAACAVARLSKFWQWGTDGAEPDQSDACASDCRQRGVSRLTVTEQCDLMRLTLLLLNVGFILLCFDVSAVYHFMRGGSLLKLYVIFNMLEMFERWCRSFGVDLFDMLMASVRHPWSYLLPRYIVTLVYCCVHTTMHFLRVLLLNSAINTSSSAVWLIIVTNNFGEIKSTVFKRYDAKSLFPIVTSDIVERFYLVVDIVFVMLRLSSSVSRNTYQLADIFTWFVMLVVIELGTDWIKFCLIIKFSELQASTLDLYREVLLADILLSRSRTLVRKSSEKDPSVCSIAPPPAVPLRGICSFSHVPARRIGFSGVPVSTLVVVHFVMLIRSPCGASLQNARIMMMCFAFGAFVLTFLAKALLGICLLGFAAKRRTRISKGLELFPKIKAL